VISAALREACLPVRAIDETSAAVARGNQMVFAEIGREFARFVPLIRGGDADLAEVKRFCDDLRPGDLPEGQALLRAAFRDYGRALRAADGKTQAELVLLANLRISLHEQTRLQPEIAAALNAPVPELEEVKERLLARLFPEGRARRRLRARLPRSLDLKGPFDQACGRLAEQIRRSVRAVITNALMTLTLPGETLRLGADLAGSYPAHLQSIANAELSELLRGIDPTADSPRESGAQDWADLAERMHYTADFFRMRQEDAALLGPPFAADQTEAIKEGRPPSGRL
jgi:hypothetical protein